MPERKSFLLVIFLIIFMSVLGTILQILRIEYGWAATQSQASYITAFNFPRNGIKVPQNCLNLRVLIELVVETVLPSIATIYNIKS